MQYHREDFDHIPDPPPETDEELELRAMETRCSVCSGIKGENAAFCDACARYANQLSFEGW